MGGEGSSSVMTEGILSEKPALLWKVGCGLSSWDSSGSHRGMWEIFLPMTYPVRLVVGEQTQRKGNLKEYGVWEFRIILEGGSAAHLSEGTRAAI